MIKEYIHKDLASGRWFELTLAEQLGNIGSEYYRACQAFEKNNKERFDSAVDRTLELIELTIDDKRWHHKSALGELCRMKEQVAESLVIAVEPDKSLQKYFDSFAILARK